MSKTEFRFLKYLSPTLISFLGLLLVPLLYIIGYYYDYGYLLAFGITNEFFPKTVHGYLISAFSAINYAYIALMNLIVEYFLYVLAAVFLYFSLLGLIHFLKRKLSPNGGLEPIDVKKGTFLWDVVVSLEWIQKIAIVSLVVLIPFLFGMLSYLGGLNVGDEKAQKFQSCQVKNISLTTRCAFILSDGEEIKQGLLVAKSPTNIALWDGQKTIVYPLTDEIVEIRFGSSE